MHKTIYKILCLGMVLIASCSAPGSPVTTVSQATMPISPTETRPPTAVIDNQTSQDQIMTEVPTLEPASPTPTFSIINEIPYATSLQPDATRWNLDIYVPNSAVEAPVVVFAHGFKAVKEGHKRESKVFAENGILVYTITWPTWIADLAEEENGRGYREMFEVFSCAIRYARGTAQDYGGDPSQLILAGFSMGATEGALTALGGEAHATDWETFAAEKGGPPQQVDCAVEGASQEVNAFLGVGGYYDLPDRLLGRKPELWNLASPYAIIGGNPDLQLRLLHGAQDENRDPETSIQFNQTLQEAGYDSELILYDGVHLVPAELTAEVILELAGE
ncbi:MAG: hypothetical protein JSV42_12265 [Chloroflexota bacterium]|nr:MAG: hypothetical protein JSV42_12265 [Chloroflexota bacterium]